MELLTTSVLTLLALYVIYSEPIQLPKIIKKNKKLSYILIIGLYLYYHQNNDVEGFLTHWEVIGWIGGLFSILLIIFFIATKSEPHITKYLEERAISQLHKKNTSGQKG